MKIVLVNFRHTMFSPLDFLSFEDGTHKLSHNVGGELPPHAMQYLRRAQISHDDLAMQTPVWLCMVWFHASYVNFRQPQHNTYDRQI